LHFRDSKEFRPVRNFLLWKSDRRRAFAKYDSSGAIIFIAEMRGVPDGNINPTCFADS
jgi:hypothetical protein